MMLMNAWLDSLFEPSNSFIHLLINNEVVNGQADLPQVDGTDFMFNVSVERFGGEVFLDGLDSNGQNQEITLRSNNLFFRTNNVYLNPPLEVLNSFNEKFIYKKIVSGIAL